MTCEWLPQSDPNNIVELFTSKSSLIKSLKIALICPLEHLRIKIQGLVVQSIVSLTISLRHKFVKQISAKVTNTLLFFVEKM